MAPLWPLLRVEVAEDSMLPGLRPGDWLVARRTRRIRPGQVVLAWMPPRGGHPARPEYLLVKRATRRVDGGWWLESDNPAAAAVDSNRFGPVGDDLIVGYVLARYWPQFKSRFLCPRNGSHGPVACPSKALAALAAAPPALSRQRPRSSQ